VDLQQAWTFGRADASSYDPSKGAAYYVTKDIALGIVDYDISPAKGHPDVLSSTR
jgi:hypothetical protein